MPKGHLYGTQIEIFVSEYWHDGLYELLTSKYWLCTMEFNLFNATKETYDPIVIEYFR